MRRSIWLRRSLSLLALLTCAAGAGYMRGPGEAAKTWHAAREHRAFKPDGTCFDVGKYPSFFSAYGSSVVACGNPPYFIQGYGAGPFVIFKENLYVLNGNRIYAFKVYDTTPSKTVQLSTVDGMGRFAIDHSGHFWATGRALFEFSKKGRLMHTLTCPYLGGYGSIVVDRAGDVFVEGGSAVAEWPAGSPNCELLPYVVGGSELHLTSTGNLVVMTSDYPNGGYATTYAAPSFNTVLSTTEFPIIGGSLYGMGLSSDDQYAYVGAGSNSNPAGGIELYQFPSGQDTGWGVAIGTAVFIAPTYCAPHC